MSDELTSLIANRVAGEQQVAARKAHLATLSGDEVEGHKASLAREEADLATVTKLIESLSAHSKPKH